MSYTVKPQKSRAGNTHQQQGTRPWVSSLTQKEMKSVSGRLMKTVLWLCFLGPERYIPHWTVTASPLTVQETKAVRVVVP